MAVICPECDAVAPNVASEEIDAIGGVVCGNCGFTAFAEDFEFTDDEDEGGE